MVGGGCQWLPGHREDIWRITPRYLHFLWLTQRGPEDISQMSPHCRGNVLETWLRPGKKSGDVLQMSWRCPGDVWAILQRHRRVLKVPCSRIFFAEINRTDNAVS